MLFPHLRQSDFTCWPFEGRRGMGNLNATTASFGRGIISTSTGSSTLIAMESSLASVVSSSQRDGPCLKLSDENVLAQLHAKFLASSLEWEGGPVMQKSNFDPWMRARDMISMSGDADTIPGCFVLLDDNPIIRAACIHIIIVVPHESGRPNTYVFTTTSREVL
jgi:hypothetical protein